MRVHIVQKGDTLWKIAKQYSIGFDELKRLNAHLANPDYIVPGMEIYLPDMAAKKEAPTARPAMKEQVKEQVKEQPKEQPRPVPTIIPKPQMPAWQGDIYFQPQMPPQPMPMPMPQQMPQWQQTHVHFQPQIEQTMVQPAPIAPVATPAPQPMPQMQPVQPQPIFIQQPPMQPQFIPQMMPMPMPQPIPVCPRCQSMPMSQPQPVPVCSRCHGMLMDEWMMTSPIHREESPERAQENCSDKEQQVQNYFEEIQQMEGMQNPCCPPQMQPYPMMMPGQMEQQMPQMWPQQMTPQQMMPCPCPRCQPQWHW